MINFIVWIVLGLVAGGIAKWIMPGKDPGGALVTIGLGIAGAFVGGFVGQRLGIATQVGGFSLVSLATAVAGALLLLFGYRLIKGRKSNP